MTGRELVYRTLAQQEVERLPRDLWTVPYIGIYRMGEYERLTGIFPADITGPSWFRYGASHYSKGAHSRKGKYVDEFGAHWEALEDGVVGEVKDAIIKTPADLDKYRIPWEIIDGASTSDGAAKAYRETEKYVLAGTNTRLFERLQFLMGTEELFVQIATGDPMFLRLRDMLHEFHLKDVKLAASQAADGVSFMDDWGSQKSLLISPAAWRKYFKPLYKEYCDIIHAAGKHAFFHSDGYTEPIIGDLIEIGVDALNTQLFCMDIEDIAARYAGKITFWGELDRQHILPFGTADEVRQSVRRLAGAFLKGRRTGLIAELSWETVTPFENVAAAYDEFLKV